MLSYDIILGQSESEVINHQSDTSVSGSCNCSQLVRRFRNEERSPSQPPHVTVGRCTLSDKDKSVQPDAFRAAPYNEEYMENQCHDRPIEPDNCSYELYANSSFIYAEAKYLGLTQKEVRQSQSPVPPRVTPFAALERSRIMIEIV